MVRAFDPTTRALILFYKYALTIPNGALLPDAAALHETAELLEIAERSGDDFTLACARFVRGLTLVNHGRSRNAQTASRCLPRPAKPPYRSASL